MISLLLCVMAILVNPGLADGVGWVVEGMDVDAVVMLLVGKKNTIG